MINQPSHFSLREGKIPSGLPEDRACVISDLGHERSELVEPRQA